MESLTQLQSQILGLTLAFLTAISCIFYDKIVHNFSYFTIIFLITIEAIFLFTVSSFLFKDTIYSDYNKFISEPKYIVYLGICCVTSVSSIIWYIISRDSSVMVGGIYEVKYVVILAILYILFGDEKFTFNTFIGVLLALSSIYFISKK